ncbi:MAG: hypothetical protein K0S44_587 [Bacteroidetes bacterium]|nr:hypothetical protein [Bacteroidota bacterium]
MIWKIVILPYGITGNKDFPFSLMRIISNFLVVFIDLFKSQNYTLYETEVHEWGEKRLSFDDANIDFYFERDKLTSINYGKPLNDQPILILPN